MDKYFIVEIFWGE